MKTVFFVLLFVFMQVSGLACDICGNYMGITPYDNKSNISFLHRYRVFNGYRDYQTQSHFFPHSAYRVNHMEAPKDSLIIKNYSSNDFESYKIFELRFKYFVVKRLELNVFLPLLNNKSKTDEAYVSHTGFGDLSFNAGFHALTPKADKTIRHKLILGLGIKLPTGNINATADAERLPFEMQTGSGSFDAFGYINYVCMTKHLGLNVNLNYKVNGENKYQEQMNNSHNDFISLFYKIPLMQITMYPSVQANYEFTKGLLVKNTIQKNTGVNSLLLGPGLDLYYKSFSLNFAWQFSVLEKINTGSLKSAGRLSLGLNYSFGNKK